MFKVKAAAAVLVAACTLGLGAWSAAGPGDGPGNGPGSGGSGVTPGGAEPGGQKPAEKRPADLEWLQGRWHLVTYEDSGGVNDARFADPGSYAVEIRGDVWRERPGDNGFGRDVTATVVLNPDKQPAEIDLVTPDGKRKQGVYRLQPPDPRTGVEFVVVVSSDGNRPTALTQKGGRGDKVFWTVKGFARLRDGQAPITRGAEQVGGLRADLHELADALGNWFGGAATFGKSPDEIREYLDRVDARLDAARKKVDELRRQVLAQGPDRKPAQPAPAPQYTVEVRDGNRKAVPLTPAQTKAVAELAGGMVGSCCGELVTPPGSRRFADKDRWKRELAGPHVRVTYPKPRSFGSAGNSKEPVMADEILIPLPPGGRDPEYVLARLGTTYRAFFDYYKSDAPDLRKVVDAARGAPPP